MDGVWQSLPGGESTMTAEEAVVAIRAALSCSWTEPTVDRFVAGDPAAEVTGVAVTFMATIDVLREAAESGCNLVITHEPTFYGHHDDAVGLGNDAIATAKRALIAEAGLAIWRFHDHLHRHCPDAIFEGLIRALGWESNRIGDSYRFRLPELPLRALVGQLRSALGGPRLRVVGNIDSLCSDIALSVGAPGFASQLSSLQRPDVDVLVAGEAREWETVEYARDAAAVNPRKGLVLLGHLVSEEPGMAYTAEWLSTVLSPLPVEFLAAGEPFQSLGY